MDVPLTAEEGIAAAGQETRLVESPLIEFSRFCRGRMEGLALTLDSGSLEPYRQACEKGEEILRKMEEYR